jgi:hypothetical protein
MKIKNFNIEMHAKDFAKILQFRYQVTKIIIIIENRIN